MILSGLSKINIDKAVELLRNDEVVGVPTETVYGLAANALSAVAVEKVFQLKGRPKYNPLIIHIPEKRRVEELAQKISPAANLLMEKFWPGPLTLILEKKTIVPDIVTAGLSTVAVRMPSHPIMNVILHESGLFLAAPSANRFQGVSPTTALAVEQELGEELTIIDGGACSIGVESTVVDTVGGIKVLRLGGLDLEAIESVLGAKVMVAGHSVGPKGHGLKSPGLLEFHYAPKTPLRFMQTEKLQLDLRQENDRLSQTGLIVFDEATASKFRDAGLKRIGVLSSRGDLQEASQNLFATLREFDGAGLSEIVALEVPDRGLGRAINDRLRRASH